MSCTVAAEICVQQEGPQVANTDVPFTALLPMAQWVQRQALLISPFPHSWPLAKLGLSYTHTVTHIQTRLCSDSEP